jgi:CRISPR-associated protein Cst2
MPYPPFVRVSGRFTVEVSALVSSGSIGNYTQIATAKLVLLNGTAYEGVPIITGNSLKHWHSVYLVENYVSLGGKYANILCKHGIGLRGLKHDVDSFDKISKDSYANSEQEAIIDVCNDIHGFLIPEKQLKRDSIVEVSNAIPVLTEDNLENVSKFAIQYNRVVPYTVSKNLGEGQEGQGMMVFKQEHASVPLFGFAMSMDLGWILRPKYEGDGSIVSELPNKDNVVEERRRRARAALLAMLNLINGGGSKQARSLPIIGVQELMIVASNVPIPKPVHAAFENYATQTIDALRVYANNVNDAKIYVHCYSASGKPINGCEQRQGDKIQVHNHSSLEDMFNNVINETLSIM